MGMEEEGLMTWQRSANSTRRDFFHWGAEGLGATALMQLLLQDGKLLQGSEVRPVAKAKRAVQICLVGGLSHLDSLDYKPELEKFHGKSLETDTPPDIFFGQVGLIRRPDWRFAPRGNSGLWLSELFPHLAAQADRLTILRSMVSDSANHTPALFLSNSGFGFNGFPSVGSWLSFGLGSESDSLPAYVVLPDGRGGPNGSASNWTSGFLPTIHQGVVFQQGKNPVRDLFPSEKISREEDQAALTLLGALEGSGEAEGIEPVIAARRQGYELAARMQLAVPEVSQLESESQATRDLYGIDQPVTDDAGRRCLLARRLLERGVRFVQVFSGGPIAGTPRSSWDAHENVLENHGAEASRIDRPVAALLADLHQRGMLEDTLVLFTTEFGRTPFTQSGSDQVGTGRDHNRPGFSVWMAGAGLRPGIAYGATDEIGWKVVESPVAWHDFHATLLHLFGIDHTKLTFYHNGIQRRLTNVHGEVVQSILS
jgi:hypothetical protein